MSTGSQLLSAVPNALQGLALPSPAAAASLTSFSQLLSLLTPVNLTVASASMPIIDGHGRVIYRLGYAAHYDPDGASKKDAILERLRAVSGGSATGGFAYWVRQTRGQAAARHLYCQPV